MARKIKLHPHLTADELFAHYMAAPTPAAARRVHALWLIAQGHTAQAAAAHVGLSSEWVRALVQRYNRAGLAGLQDRRTSNPGRAPLLTPAQQQRLTTLLGGPAPDGGVWTGPKVAAWIAAETGHATYPQQGWAYLRRLGFTVQAPRPPRLTLGGPREHEYV